MRGQLAIIVEVEK